MLVALAALFGLVVGSFLNVCIVRLPIGASVSRPGSHCQACRTPIRWFENIPLVSYAVLAGRCRHCGKAISVQYPLVEGMTAVLFALVASRFQPDLLVVGKGWLLTAALVVLSGTDYAHRRLPNVITWPGLAAGLILAIWTPPGVIDAMIGAAFGAGVLALVRWAWMAATGVEGMGLGDVKMLAMIGAFLGWQQTILVLFLATVSGAAVGLLFVAFGGRSLQTRLPFGCFLAVAAWIALVAGRSLIGWYTGLYS